MSRIAIIDTYVDSSDIHNGEVHHISLCEKVYENHMSHGTICAKVLDQCTCGYELISLNVFPSSSSALRKPKGKVDLLRDALNRCIELRVDIVVKTDGSHKRRDNTGWTSCFYLQH